MKRLIRHLFRLGPLPLLLAGASALSAQGVTTGSVTGIVTSGGAPAAGATIVATHVASGTRYAAQARGDGHYSIPAMRVGGPYTVTARRIGLQPRSRDSIFVTLGEAATVDFDLSQAAVQVEGVVVRGSAGSVMSSDRTGAATTVTREGCRSPVRTAGSTTSRSTDRTSITHSASAARPATAPVSRRSRSTRSSRSR
jgi:Carboxypeptidase regulatory-like domain